MTRRWLGYASEESQRDVCAALATVSSSGRVSFVRDAQSLRLMLHGEEPRSVSAVVGMCDEGVSDINLAAALVRDACAEEVVLVAHDVSGSLRSRAAAAGITRLIDMDEALSPVQAAVVQGQGEEGRFRGTGLRAGEKGTAVAWVGPSAGQTESGLRATALGEEDAGDVGLTEPERRGAALHVSGGLEIVAGRTPSETDRWPHGHRASWAQAALASVPRAPVVTLASGRGGVGKTLITACFASIAAAWGMRVALVDLDLCHGNLYAHFGLDQGSDLARLRADRLAEGADRIGCPCGEDVTLWGPCALPEMAETVMPLVGELLASLATTHELVLVDTTATCTDATAQAMQLADRLVLVGGPEQADIVSVARAGALAVRLGVARTRIMRVENRCHPRALGQPFMPRAERGLETARTFRVVDGGEEVGELALTGQVGAICAASDDLARTLAHALAQILIELGSLPDHDAARRAADDQIRRASFGLFGRRREAS